METLPPLNIVFVNAFGAQPAETLKKSEQLELPLMKVQFPAITGYTFPAITEPGSNTFVSSAAK